MKKLYRVTIRYEREFYVVAQDPHDAYLKIRKYLDDKDIHFTGDRELKMVELLADEEGDCRTLLVL